LRWLGKKCNAPTKKSRFQLGSKIVCFFQCFKLTNNFAIIVMAITRRLGPLRRRCLNFFLANILVLLRRVSYHNKKIVIQSKMTLVSFQCANVSYAGTCLSRSYKSTFSNLPCCKREEAERIKKRWKFQSITALSWQPVIPDFSS